MEEAQEAQVQRSVPQTKDAEARQAAAIPQDQVSSNSESLAEGKSTQTTCSTDMPAKFGTVTQMESRQNFVLNMHLLPCSAPPPQKLDSFQIIKFPLTTESAMKKIEDNNTLVCPAALPYCCS